MNMMTRQPLLPLMIGVLLAIQGLHAQDSLTVESLAADRDLWPREVTIQVEHQLPVVINGRQVGSSKIAAGRTYPLKAVVPGGVKVDALGADLEFPAHDTDLLERAEKAKKAHEARAAAAPPPPAAAEDAGGEEAEGAPADAGASSPASTNAIAKKISGDLVSLAGGRRLKRLEDDTLESKNTSLSIFPPHGAARAGYSPRNSSSGMGSGTRRTAENSKSS